jgi:hypothetical protein
MAKTATARKTETKQPTLQELARAQRVALEAGKAGYSRARPHFEFASIGST